MSDNTILPERRYLDINIPISEFRLISTSPQVYRLIFRIDIYNSSRLGIRLMGRKWTMTDAKERTFIIEADHVFRQDPHLSPGAVFSYGGYHDFPAPPKNLELRLFGIDQMLTPFISTPCVFKKWHFRLSG